MRMSCNGCRVLRKGCSADCSIRPCLQWIKSPESQANATVFLAKFYGRAGLMNLINAGPQHLRPTIFRSLLYEACGRIVNPIYGSVGLMQSGTWQLCQNAVEAVLRGASITQIASEDVQTNNGQLVKAYDIRHVNKVEKISGSNDLRRVRARCQFKRSGKKDKSFQVCVGAGDETGHEKMNLRSTSHDSSLSHQSETAARNLERDSRDSESLLSEETAEAEVVARVEAESFSNKNERAGDGEIELELSLGFEPFPRLENVKPKQNKQRKVIGPANDDGVWKLELGLDYPARERERSQN